MVSFEVADGEAATRVLSRVRVCSHATSLGGIETLLSSPARSSHASLAADERARRGITDGLLRLSVGIEDPDDLWDDLAQALESA
jgi:cystathionine beta-lyase/cystathionine gamma-synthase